MISNASGVKLAGSMEFVILRRGDTRREPRGVVFASEEACGVRHSEGIDLFSCVHIEMRRLNRRSWGGGYNHQESCWRWSWSAWRDSTLD